MTNFPNSTLDLLIEERSELRRENRRLWQVNSGLVKLADDLQASNDGLRARLADIPTRVVDRFVSARIRSDLRKIP